MSKQRCGNCKFWNTEGREIEDFIGDCRRFPPTIVPVVTYNEPGEVYTRPDRDTEFPETYGDDWCGEYKAVGRKR